ncbi:MAG: hypothetical protein ACKOEB_04830 [Actinomycetota bacterium]
MRFTAIIAAFLIGLITGVAATPESQSLPNNASQRREIVIVTN